MAARRSGTATETSATDTRAIRATDTHGTPATGTRGILATGTRGTGTGMRETGGGSGKRVGRIGMRETAGRVESLAMIAAGASPPAKQGKSDATV